MYNWNTDTNRLAKNKGAFEVWKLNQMINFGLGGEKIDSRKIKKYWNKLSLDPKRERFLRWAVWGKLS